jgi:hypothetical protein
MFKVRLVRGNLNVTLPFIRPITDWQPAIPRFFEMIYQALSPAFAIAPNQLSINPALKLGETNARFNLYGGPNSVTLFSDRLTFEFVSLISSDYPVVYDLMRRVHDAFPSSFPSCGYNTVETQSYIHFDIMPPDEVGEYLERFHLKGALDSFSIFGAFVEEKIARFGAIAADQSWQCRFGVDRSLLLANGIFVDLSMTLRNQTKEVTFLDKLQFAEKIGAAARAALRLESADA